MEVLPCSGVQCTGESDRPQQNPGTAFLYQGEPNYPENGQQVKFGDSQLNELSHKMEGSQIEKQGEEKWTVCHLSTNSDVQCSRDSGCGFQGEDQKEDSALDDLDDDLINEPCLTSENSLLVVDTIESESPNNREGDLSFSEPKWLEGDEPVALWVKWRGKWQTGIRCARADRPLSTLRAKPTHGRKKYFVIFFPHTRNYSWADMLLVRSIDEFPHPIAYKTHWVGLKMVSDLTIARRFIMQKLAIGMLNIVDQLHPNALTETARDVKGWKEFAMGASHCTGYSEFGRMLLKLHNSILQPYINADWLHHSSHSWAERCHIVNSAESVELLKEELSDSILWNDVNSLWRTPAQPMLGSDWKSWKHDVMKWFTTSPSLSCSKDTQPQTPDASYAANLQVSRKRAKLEVRRADTHASQAERKDVNQSVALETDLGFFKNQDTLSLLAAENGKHEDVREVSAANDLTSNVTNKWNEIVVEAANSDCLHTKGMELTPVSEMAVSKSVEPGSKNRQCIAYIESKGRQCVRWANDGDVYCCVHLSSRFLGSSEKAEKLVPVDTPMCEGTTVLGTKCKHRALPGFLFCKKHRPHDETEKISHSPQSTLKRKLEENYAGSVNTCRDIVLVNSESPLEVEPVSFIGGDYFQRKSSLGENPTHPDNNYDAMKGLHCIGSPPFDDKNPCREAPKRYCLYCENHLPSWLKRARNGKSRIVSKEVFTELLRDCSSWEQKVHLHKACELFYRLFKSILSLRNPVPKDVQFQWALTEASKDTSVGEFFTKLVHSEKARIKLIWGFGDDLDVSPIMEEPPLLPSTTTDSIDNENAIKCKICSAEFSDDQALGNHWMDSHKKEAQWLFRGYACAICLDSFTNKKLLETHVQERHHVQFVEQCMLLQCIPCGSHFGNSEQLWQHVLSVHPVDLKPSKAPERQTLPAGAGQDSPVKHVQENSAPLENNSENPGVLRKFTCRFCGLKFDLLPDLGRHHQAAHMGPNLVSNHPAKKGVRYYAYRLKSGRLSRPKFKKGLAAASYRIRNRANANLKRGIQATKSLGMRDMSLQPRVTSLQPQVTTSLQPHVTETSKISKFAEHQCSGVAKILFSEIQKTKPRPNNLDILSIARTACCKVSLAASLEEKFGILPKRIYLKAAKLCAEHNIIVNWHHEGFICPRGCNGLKDQALLSPLSSLPNSFVRPKSVSVSDHASDEWELDEFHCIINSHGLKLGSLQKSSIFCDDISFGKESTPVICVVDQELLHSINKNGSNDQDTDSAMPWKSFTYVTKAMLDQSLSLDSESLQLGCSCSYSSCCPETCDHVYLFGNDYEDANDIFGKPMRGRFPYDENGRIILEEGYLVYECNRRCRCNKSCPNRILQNGVRVKLEVFKTENKGWGVRAGEAILRGTFVCEYIGEVLDVQEAHNRRKRYGTEHCSYFYDIDDHVNDMSRLIEGQAHYIIDATKYGNVSRFINHSCSPNLVNHQVLVESMDCERAHIGLYASRDIALGEELTHDYHYKLVSGEGTPCLCGASKCRGRLY
ncbi:histone-lysine N-methyltransferase SUVR5 isoform X1 [Arachis ipaensis]|uniref:Histone-lysine N-methyltransferase n=2 Tax=Arachis TaxID=3817 RepID=A0A444Z9Y9_ARAHY|nr:histone-lysine N-methyltransferase SUVR5 isoform X1 [Arachis ipaensis]XP_016201787.1 histone-lysine N-methyltransferase SUVR5 isoform X1 [Arachis ipaensis]XP_016201788.1 histone-lysine N-methyltransferase SUVR5 isoform X1 [Arachis ipaensis]XP_025652881.1 histone-lysine N-methyltransferase SUVR5 isoform X1 [Arachis hypogaea]XP_025652883.1 histone-lysine N-methyltransferase SUVR5 isoform X1 [Arachis hypogaea]XP_029149263.1 histone-lysine N-methyltransferase SUVR5 isoform X1 [Arachis hypogaea]